MIFILRLLVLTGTIGACSYLPAMKAPHTKTVYVLLKDYNEKKQTFFVSDLIKNVIISRINLIIQIGKTVQIDQESGLLKIFKIFAEQIQSHGFESFITDKETDPFFLRVFKKEPFVKAYKKADLYKTKTDWDECRYQGHTSVQYELATKHACIRPPIEPSTGAIKDLLIQNTHLNPLETHIPVKAAFLIGFYGLTFGKNQEEINGLLKQELDEIEVYKKSLPKVDAR